MVFQKIDKESRNTITSALSIFDIPPTNVTVSSSAVREYLTLNPISDTPYLFKIHPTSSFIDMNKCYLQTEMRVRKRNDEGNLVNLVATDNVSTIQGIGFSWIKNIKVKKTFESFLIVTNLGFC